VAHPQKGEVQQREVKRVEEEKVQRKWHKRERAVKGAKGGLAATSKRQEVAVAVPNHVLKVLKGE